MAISDEERREAARKLRELDVHDWYDAMDEVDSLESAIGCCFEQRQKPQKWWNRLADLIEPQSVEPEAVTIYVGPRSEEMDVWACPACGEVVSYDFDDYNPKTDGPRYCSGCGRKVAKW